jgi:uncharacterized phage-associated protein
MSYDELKTAQAAAFLLRQAGGSLPYIKLLKLLYLAERQSFRRFGTPLTGDNLVSMTHGPVLSQTYDHMKGARQSCPGGWETWVADQADYMVSLTEHGRRAEQRDFGDLSRSDVAVLEQVWSEFGRMDKWALVDYTHTLPEWEDPHGSSYPIEWMKLFEAVGYAHEDAAQLLQELKAQRALDSQFA